MILFIIYNRIFKKKQLKIFKRRNLMQDNMLFSIFCFAVFGFAIAAIFVFTFPTKKGGRNE